MDYDALNNLNDYIEMAKADRKKQENCSYRPQKSTLQKTSTN